MNIHLMDLVCPFVCRVATMSSNIPLVWMSLLTLALTDKCCNLPRAETTRQAIRTRNLVTMLKLMRSGIELLG